MPLVVNNLESLYNGVNQQSAEFRSSTQVEEMVNAMPTIDKGLLKRNPTVKQALDSAFNVDVTDWLYHYSRDEHSQYLFRIIPGTGLEIVSVTDGAVASEHNGKIVMSSNAYMNYMMYQSSGKPNFAAVTIKDTTFIVNRDMVPKTLAASTPTANIYTAYMWFKSANPSHPYTYEMHINGDTVTATGKTTLEAAEKMVTEVNKLPLMHASAIGSMVEIVSTIGIATFSATDSYGNQASESVFKEVSTTADLPRNMGFTGVTVKVVGTSGNDTTGYWLTFDGHTWKETQDPGNIVSIDPATMPHIVVDNHDGTFTIKQYEWGASTVGDAKTSPMPNFLEGSEEYSSPIRDIFFFKNRMGLLTANGIALSEVGSYGNFFRTSAVTVLASDPIVAIVDTTAVVSLEHAVALENSMLLFADNLQFSLQGGKVLSPKDVQVAQVSSYNANMNIKPILVNDKVFFVSKRGAHAAVMQYQVRTNVNSLEAIDITAHVQNYIPVDVVSLQASNVDNMLFVLCKGSRNLLYVYKYYDENGTRVQSAWFKWEYNGYIRNIAVMRGKLNMFIERSSSKDESDWVVGSGLWDMNKLWDMRDFWVMSPTSLHYTFQLERQEVSPLEYEKTTFTDCEGDSDAADIRLDVALGEWIFAKKGVKDNNGHLKMKTIEVSAEPESSFNLEILDIKRGKLREIIDKYVLGRKPMVYGDSRNVRINIVDHTSKGLRISAITLEGALTRRNKTY